MRIGLGRRVDNVIRTQHQDDVGLTKLWVDVFHLNHLLVGYFGLGQQNIHVAWHSPSDRMNRVTHVDAAMGEFFGQFLERVLGPGNRQAIPRHNDHALCIAQQKSGIVGRTAADIALDAISPTGCGVRGLSTKTAQDHVEKRAVHRLAHDVAQDCAGATHE